MPHARRRYPSDSPIPQRAPNGLLDEEIEKWWWDLLPNSAKKLTQEAVLAIRATTRNIHRRGRPIAHSQWNPAYSQAETYGTSTRGIKILVTMPPYMVQHFMTHARQEALKRKC